MTNLQHILQKYWGYSTFRPLQAEAIRAAMENRDSLVVLPTGGGKSLCFQVPILARQGIAVVVSPLISLMKDQVDALRACGVPADFLNSTTDAADRNDIMVGCRRGEIKLLYVAPERLANPGFVNFLRGCPVAYFVVDEAHCISMWGHDFRPDYRNLRQLRNHFPDAPIHAFTATATPKVRDDIASQLNLRNPEILVGSFDRPNLSYFVTPRRGKLRQIQDILARFPDTSGVIYCISRKDTERLAEDLRGLGYSAQPYHAGMNDSLRKKHQEAFVKDKVRIIVATVAFGMGIDKPDVRFVIHVALPKAIENYQQESGRAGRDGLPAECHLLYTNHDYMTWRQIMAKSTADPDALEHMYEKLDEMWDFCRKSTCRHRALVKYFGQSLKQKNCKACDYCLNRVPPIAPHHFEPPPVESHTPHIDPLIVGQMILSCVLRLREAYDLDYVAEVLCGSQNKDILERRHNELSTYGLLSMHPIPRVQNWTQQLLAQGFLDRDSTGALHVTPEGRLLLRGERTPQLADEHTPSNTASAPHQAPAETLEERLFQELRRWRRATADEQNIPPFLVFEDTTLLNLAAMRPSNKHTLLQVHGIGRIKADRYGKYLLPLIRRFCEQHDLPLDVGVRLVAHEERTRSSGTQPSTRRLSRTERAARVMFENGESPEAVRQALARSVSWAYEQLAEWLREQGTTEPEPWVDTILYARFEAIVSAVGTARLRPIYDLLDGEVPYEVIRTCISIYENRHHASKRV